MSLRNKLVSFSASVMHFLKDMPVSIKVTAYYTLFLGLLLLLVTMSGFQMAKYLEIKEMDKVLLEVTVRASRNEKAFDVYDRNVYLPSTIMKIRLSTAHAGRVSSGAPPFWGRPPIY